MTKNGILIQNCISLCQWRSISKRRLIRKIWVLDEKQFNEIKREFLMYFA
jgi:hypothetical protein